jgi:myosin heavy subunit
VFFKAGVLAHLEDLRDEKLAWLMTGFQAAIRWYCGQTDCKRKIEQRAGLLILQRNVRQWCTLRTWEWFKLYGKVKPLLKAGKEGEEMDKLNSKITELEESLSKEEKLRKELEGNNTKLLEEKNALFQQLEGSKGNNAEAEERLQKLNAQKNDLDKQLAELNDRLSEQEDRNNDVSRSSLA